MNQIRKAKKEDIPQVIALLRQVAQIHHNIRPDVFKSAANKYTEEELARIFVDENTPVFVSCSETGAVQGYAFCAIRTWENHPLLQDRKTVYIDDLCVDENCRGKHVGQQLYAFIKAFAKQIGADSVTLNVWEGNEKAIAFYRHLGMGVQRYYMEDIL